MGRPGEAEGNNGHYEIRPAGIKGNGAFVLRDIPAGTRIFVDNALFSVPFTEGLPADQSDVLQAVKNLSAEEKKQWDELPGHKVPSLSDPAGLPEGWKGTLRFELNSFKFLRQPTQGCFCHASRFNHSCLPKCTMSSTKLFQRQCFVHQDVKKGEELTFAYNVDLLYMTKSRRQRYIAESLNIQSCACEHCNTSMRDTAASDIRRDMMRGFIYLQDRLDLHTLQGWNEPLPRSLNANITAQDRTKTFIEMAEAEKLDGVSSGQDRLPEDTLAQLSQWLDRAKQLKVLTVGNEAYENEDDDKIEVFTGQVEAFIACSGLFG